MINRRAIALQGFDITPIFGGGGYGGGYAEAYQKRLRNKRERELAALQDQEIAPESAPEVTPQVATEVATEVTKQIKAEACAPTSETVASPIGITVVKAELVLKSQILKEEIRAEFSKELRNSDDETAIAVILGAILKGLNDSRICSVHAD